MAESGGPDPLDVRQLASLVEVQLRGRGIRDERVLRAFARVRRARYVPPAARAEAYADYPLPIGSGQTISQPYVVAYMLEALALRPGERVLEIGTGSGYQTALLLELALQVFTVELVPELAHRARRVLEEEGYGRVEMRVGDGRTGWPEKAPFDAIIGSAAAAEIPPDLTWQLGHGGRLILPVGRPRQRLVLLARTPAGWQERQLIRVRFVPLRHAPG